MLQPRHGTNVIHIAYVGPEVRRELKYLSFKTRPRDLAGSQLLVQTSRTSPHSQRAARVLLRLLLLPIVAMARPRRDDDG